MKKPKPQAQAVMAEKWPHLFSFPVPLKVGIHKDFPPAGERPLSSKQFNTFLYYWVRQPGYIEALKTGKHRYGLDGSMYPLLDGDRNGR
jgi:sRNA-binding protein